MDDTLRNKQDLSMPLQMPLQQPLQTALALGKLLDDHKGGDVLVMDMRPLDFWTDFFIIATVTSNTHLLGLERHIKEYVRENDLEILRRSNRSRSNRPGKDTGQRLTEQGSNEWCLLDLGNIVIHLMTAGTRSFFELERLWGSAPLIFGNSAAHSSKSS